MANAKNDVPAVDQTARIPAKPIPAAPSGVGNPGSATFGGGEVSTTPRNPAVSK